MVDFFIKTQEGQEGQPSSFQRFIMEHDIRHTAQDAGVSRIMNDSACDVIGESPYEELASDVRAGMFDLETLQKAMEEEKDEYSQCNLREIRKRAIELQKEKPVTNEILTGWELD